MGLGSCATGFPEGAKPTATPTLAHLILFVEPSVMSTANNIRCLMVGAGDHARVLIDVIKAQGFSEFRSWTIVALTDANSKLHGQTVLGVPVAGDDLMLPDLKQQGATHALVGVGLTQGTEGRGRICEMLESGGFQLPVVVHPSALISSNVEVGAGTVILAGAIVGTGCRIGKNVVVNIGAAVSHDCTLGDHSVVSDGAHITGGVVIGERALIGAGATILPYITIGESATVAAGAVVTKNVEAGTTVAGVPARALAPRPSGT